MQASPHHSVHHSTASPTPIYMVVRLIDGARFVVSGPAGSRAVDAIRAYGLALKCDTEARCHVRIADAWADRLAAPDATEKARLSAVAGAGPRSRLLCQVVLMPGLDGLDFEIDPASLVPQTHWAAG